MVDFHPYSEEWLEDPYPIYRELRAAEPVHWEETLGHWVLSRYEDVVEVLKDNEHFSASNRPGLARAANHSSRWRPLSRENPMRLSSQSACAWYQ